MERSFLLRRSRYLIALQPAERAGKNREGSAVPAATLSDGISTSKTARPGSCQRREGASAQLPQRFTGCSFQSWLRDHLRWSQPALWFPGGGERACEKPADHWRPSSRVGKERALWMERDRRRWHALQALSLPTHTNAPSLRHSPSRLLCTIFFRHGPPQSSMGSRAFPRDVTAICTPRVCRSLEAEPGGPAPGISCSLCAPTPSGDHTHARTESSEPVAASPTCPLSLCQQRVCVSSTPQARPGPDLHPGSGKAQPRALSTPDLIPIPSPCPICGQEAEQESTEKLWYSERGSL